MKTNLHDRLYLRFGLFHRRWGHAIAYMIEFVIVAVIAAVAMVAIAGTVVFAYGVVDVYRQAEDAKKEAVGYQKTLLACLNGGVIGRAGDEVIACDPAVTFKYGNVQ